MGTLSARSLDLLEARGLDGEILLRLGVGDCDMGSDWIAIPFFERGERVNTKFRTIAGEKRFAQEPGAKKIFWNIDCAADPALATLPLVVTEGEFDAMAAIQAGFGKAISVPDGAPQAPLGDGEATKYSYVLAAEKALRDEREIILATDGDAPGIALMNDLAIRFGKHRCKWVRYPKGCKDLCDALHRFGVRGVVETLNRAQWIKVEGVCRMSELPPKPERQAYDIGMAELARHYKLRLGDLAVVTGIPSHGKTAFVNEIAGRMASDPYGWTVAVASFEQEPQSDFRRNLRSFHSQKYVREMSRAEIAAADDWIERHFLFLVPDEDEEATLEWVLSRAAAAIVQQGARLIVVDPWNEMDHDRPDGMPLTEYTGFAIKQFRRLARKYSVHVIVVAHPTKLARDKDGKVPIPTLYDISDSAHWFNKPDVGIVLHREGGGARVLIRIAKVRYRDEIGEPGDLHARFLPHCGRFDVEIKDAAGA